MNSVTTVVRQSLEESIESILTTKSSIDILRKVQEYKQQHKTYRLMCENDDNLIVLSSVV